MKHTAPQTAQTNIIGFKPQTAAPAPEFAAHPETAILEQTHSIAIVTQVQNDMAKSVKLNGRLFDVIGYLSPMPGIAPCMETGDHVLISVAGEGVLIHGVILPTDTPVRASFRIIEGKLVIEAQGAMTLKSGSATVELSEAGEIHIDGKNVRTKAKKTLAMLAGEMKLN